MMPNRFSRTKLLIACLSSFGAAAACKKDSAPPPPESAPAARSDYAEQRATFKTKLIYKVPSPQPFEVPTVPNDVEVVEYEADGLQLSAWIPKNRSPQPRPAVIFLHGGFAFDNTDWEMGRPFLDAGYVLMTPVLRGENGQKGHFTLFYDEVNDVLAAAKYLASQPFVDPTRIYLSGHSAGGTLTLLSVMASKQFRAAASFSAAPDMADLLRAGWTEMAPFDTTNPAEIDLRAPLKYAASIKCPVRMYYGTEEPMFEASSKKTASLARAKGLDVQAISVKGDHMSSVAEGIKRAVEFFGTQGPS